MQDFRRDPQAVQQFAGIDTALVERPQKGLRELRRETELFHVSPVLSLWRRGKYSQPFCNFWPWLVRVGFPTLPLQLRMETGNP
ncbi:hypothetical protein D9M70_639570 [compost metagenome]